jgi:hypothetical protein
MLFEKHKQTLVRLALVAAMSFILSLMLFSPARAAEYGCGAYGRGAYDNGQVCAAATTPDEEDGGGLGNTGQALSYIIPALAILAGTIMLYRLSRKRKAS